MVESSSWFRGGVKGTVRPGKGKTEDQSPTFHNYISSVL